ncbi:exo-alpha-sialidase [Agriterribacter sp.]|uniref:exo-alpha-sialidase n=1 Tax=Agriterribacter sp. TaxID=2821509 RepID=UPI002B68210C|nr:exo-alpha-sialidase [Agriterribacter sp.]HRP57829.1 exo-alpha-sialidase [Agriterribacter sp.]
MMNTKKNICASCLLIFTLSACYAQKNMPVAKAGKTTVIAVAPTNPVLKRLDANPLLCVKVYLPAGASVDYQNIRGSLNASAIKAMDKLEVFFNGNEPLFNTTNKVASVKPSTQQISIPVDINATPGWNYIWFSASLKEDADIDTRIEFHVTELADKTNKTHPVIEQKGNYKKYSGIALRKTWDDSVHTYRIPGITTTDKGTLISVYDIRYKHAGDLPANIDVGINRSTDGGKTWEPMKNIMDMGAPHENNGVGDPAILFDPVTKKIWVAAFWSKGNRSIAGSEPGLSPDTTGQFVLVSSDDDGLTWSAPVSITTQVKNPIWHLYFNGPGNGIAMQNGTLVFASQYWDESKKPGMPHSSIIYSDDHGKTWKSGIGAKSNTTEAQVVETTPGTLMLNMRDNRGSFRSVATTKDFGKSWTEHPTSYHALPDPVCMASIIKAKVKVKGVMKDVLFFSNVNSSTARKDMTIKASLDLGETWLPDNELLLDERRLYGYSALTKIDDNTIGLIYEGLRELYFLRIPVSDIIR